MYRSGSWSGLQREAGLTVPAPGPHEALIGDRLVGILHVDDPLRLAAYERLAASASVDGLTEADRRLVTGFHFAAMPSKIAPGRSPSPLPCFTRIRPSSRNCAN